MGRKKSYNLLKLLAILIAITLNTSCNTREYTYNLMLIKILKINIGDTLDMARKEGTAKPLNDEQFQEVIDYTLSTSQHPLRDCAILQISVRVGLRVGEIAQLEMGDIMSPKGELRKQVTLRKKTTKGDKGGVAYFSHPEVRDALNRYIVEVRSKLESEHDNVFISKKGTPFSNNTLCRVFTNLYSKAGYPDAKGHSGRKSLARNLNRNNVSIYNIQQILRHSNIQTTIKHYVSVDEEVLENLVGSV